jgi:hypothetical protein
MITDPAPIWPFQPFLPFPPFLPTLLIPPIMCTKYGI